MPPEHPDRRRRLLRRHVRIRRRGRPIVQRHRSVQRGHQLLDTRATHPLPDHLPRPLRRTRPRRELQRPRALHVPRGDVRLRRRDRRRLDEHQRRLEQLHERRRRRREHGRRWRRRAFGDRPVAVRPPGQRLPRASTGRGHALHQGHGLRLRHLRIRRAPRADLHQRTLDRTLCRVLPMTILTHDTAVATLSTPEAMIREAP